MLLRKLFLTWILLSITLFPQALGRFDEDALAEHNQRRKKHGSQKMKLDPKLSKECEEDAKKQAKDKNCECEEEDDQTTTKKPDKGGSEEEEPAGENVCVTFGDPLCCIYKWYREIKYYQFCKKEQDDPSMTSHFTQVVWNSSVTLGCGMAKGNKGVKVVICRYKPPGNEEGEFDDNVKECRSVRLKIWNYSKFLIWYILVFVVSQFNLTIQS